MKSMLEFVRRFSFKREKNSIHRQKELWRLNKDNLLDSWKSKKNNKSSKKLDNLKEWANGNYSQCNSEWRWKQVDKIMQIILNIQQQNRHLVDFKRNHNSKIVGDRGNSKQVSIQPKNWPSCRHLKQQVIQEFRAGIVAGNSMKLQQKGIFLFALTEWSSNNLSNSKDDLYII